MQRKFSPKLKIVFLIFLLSMIITLISTLPVPMTTLTLPFPTPQSGNIQYPQREIVITLPQEIRRGDKAEVLLSINTPERTFEDDLTSYFKDYHVVIETKLDLNGTVALPAGTQTQPMLQDQSIHFKWNILSDNIGEKEGTLWVYLNLLPISDDSPQQYALLAKPIKIACVDFWGIAAKTLRWIGLLGGAVSACWLISLLIKKIK